MGYIWLCTHTNEKGQHARISEISPPDGGKGDDHITLLHNTPTSQVHGGPGDDAILGGPGDDTLHGSAGNDSFLDEYGLNVFRGARSRDTVHYRNVNDSIHDGEIVERIDYFSPTPLHRNQLKLDIADGDNEPQAILNFTFSNGGWKETVGQAVRSGKFITIEVRLKTLASRTPATYSLSPIRGKRE